MVLARVLSVLLLTLLVACNNEQATQPNDPKQPSKNYITQPLALPAVEQKPYILDQANLGVGGKLTLWFNAGHCQLQIGTAEPQIISPKPPCRFMRSPASERIQVMQADKVTRIVALVGSPQDSTNKECGTEVMGITVRGKVATLSTQILTGQTVCASRGLDNSAYMRFLVR